MAYTRTKAFSGLAAVLNFNPVGSPPVYATLGEIKTVKPSGQMMKSDDATNMQSLAEEFVSTIRTSGTLDIECNMLPTDPGYLAMEAIFYNQQPGLPNQGMLQFPKAPGQATRGDQRYFDFFCEKFLPGSIEPTKLIRLEISLKITGDVVTVAGV